MAISRKPYHPSEVANVPASLNQPYTEPLPTAPTNYQRQIYTALRPPSLPTSPQSWESLARRTLPESNFNYVFGSASSGSTYISNLSAFNSYRLKPSMLRNATVRDLSITLFGRKHPSPLIVGPVGVQRIVHKEGELATARACKAVGVDFVLSTASTYNMEDVAAAHDEAATSTSTDGTGDAGQGFGSERWFQLYWPRPQAEEVTASLLSRAKANGFKVLVVTLDTFTLGWRPMDLDNAYLPFIWGEGCAIGLNDPVFNAMWEKSVKNDSRTWREKMYEALDLVSRPGTVWGAVKVLRNARTVARSVKWLEVINSGTYREWEHLKILKGLWGEGPIVLKGIQRVEDAYRAIEAGMDGIVVSNHGGRQCDGAVASLDALAEIAGDERVRESGIEVLFDSGVRTGADVVKAMALGAKAVLVGRPFVYGLAMGGQAGVEHVLRCLLADADNTLANLGKRIWEEVGRGDLQVRREAKL